MIMWRLFVYLNQKEKVRPPYPQIRTVVGIPQLIRKPSIISMDCLIVSLEFSEFRHCTQGQCAHPAPYLLKLHLFYILANISVHQTSVLKTFSSCCAKSSPFHSRIPVITAQGRESILGGCESPTTDMFFKRCFLTSSNEKTSNGL